MRVIIGIDEAGYGPNLGPLVVAASAWSVPAVDDDLYSLLYPAVARRASSDRIAVADSKRLYKPGGGIDLLELGVLAVCRAVAPPQPCDRLSDLLGTPLADLPWYAGHDPDLPQSVSRAAIDRMAELLRTTATTSGVAPLGIWLRMVEPPQWNSLCHELGSKGSALSQTSLGLARQVVDSLPADVTQVALRFDKHGGRDRYAGLVQHHFAAEWVETLMEGRAESGYAWQDRDRELSATFAARGEAALPTAVASMAAKLVRELAMQGFNAYWQHRVPGLPATAGYPVDARRFAADIEPARQRLGIDRTSLWRER